MELPDPAGEVDAAAEDGAAAGETAALLATTVLTAAGVAEVPPEQCEATSRTVTAMRIGAPKRRAMRSGTMRGRLFRQPGGGMRPA
ncbi:hypothetical protein acdb102_18750 [Acidothermaceae bacterium B102]|nr:hypothetical protein acdb102_18750 [Acidothermaceae bacterium B102]